MEARAWGFPSGMMVKFFSTCAKFRIMPEYPGGGQRYMRNKKSENRNSKAEDRNRFFHSSFVIRHSSLAAVMLAMMVSLCGCQSPVQSLFTATGPDWHVQQGQAVWRPKTGLPEFGGDLVLAGDNTGRHLVQFDKTPMEILSAQTTSNRWLIKFPAKKMSFSGFGEGSTRFAWLFLPAALDGKPLPKDLKFERKSDGGWRLENLRTGESVEGFVSP